MKGKFTETFKKLSILDVTFSFKEKNIQVNFHKDISGVDGDMVGDTG